MGCGSTGRTDDTMDGGTSGDGSATYDGSGDGSGFDAAQNDGSNPGDGSSGPLQTVFIILMENRGWASLNGSMSAKYINTTLVPAGGHAEQYFTPPGLHPSEPNYI